MPLRRTEKPQRYNLQVLPKSGCVDLCGGDRKGKLSKKRLSVAKLWRTYEGGLRGQSPPKSPFLLTFLATQKSMKENIVVLPIQKSTEKSNGASGTPPPTQIH